MPKFQISEEEFELINSTINGEKVDFTNRKNIEGKIEPVKIRGIIIRNLLLELPLPFKTNDSKSKMTCYTITCKGIHIKGAVIEGIIDLSDGCGKDGSPCSPILLEDCEILGEGKYDTPSERPEASFNARHANLSRLLLKNCRVGFIDLCNAKLSNDLIIDGIEALNDNGLCRIDAKGLFLNGSLTIENSKLNLRQKRLTEVSASLADYALDLGGAKITGNIFLRPHFIADGGIDIKNIQLCGDLWADGAELKAQGNYALRAQSSCISGVLGLTCLFERKPKGNFEKNRKQIQEPTRFRAEGSIFILSAELGSLDLRGALIQSKPDEENNSFSCQSSSIKQHIRLTPWIYAKENGEKGEILFECNHQVNFWGSKILGHFFADTARFVAPAGMMSFVGNDLEVKGSLSFVNIETQNISVQNANVSGSVRFENAKGNFSEDQNHPYKGNVYADNIKVGTDLILERLVSNNLYLTGACIGGSLKMDEVSLGSVDIGNDFFTGDFRANNIKIGANLVIGRLKANEINLNNSTITGYINYDQQYFFDEINVKKLNGENLSVGKNFNLFIKKIESVNLRGVSVGSDLELNLNGISELNAEESKIAGNVYWKGSISGKGSFRGSNTKGEFKIGHNSINSSEPLILLLEKNSEPEIILEDAKVLRDLKIEGIECKENGRRLFDWDDYSLKQIKEKKLRCYADWTLYDAFFECEKNEDETSISVSFAIDKNNSIVLLDGNRRSIDEVNNSSRLNFEIESSADDNKRNNRLLLKDKGQAIDYLKFFCSNIWAEEGAFRIVESESEFRLFINTDSTLPEIKPILIEKKVEKITKTPPAHSDNQKEIVSKEITKKDLEEKEFWLAKTFVVYGKTLFKTVFHVHPDGNVEMIDDEALITTKELVAKVEEENKKKIENTPPVIDFDKTINQIEEPNEVKNIKPQQTMTYENIESKISYFSPYRITNKQILFIPSDKQKNQSDENYEMPPSIGLKSAWVTSQIVRDKKKRNKILDMVRSGQIKPKVNLKGLKVGSLDDNHGENWGENLILELDGFEYDRFETSETIRTTDERSETIRTGDKEQNNARIAFAQEASKTKILYENVSNLRIKWLEKQYRGKKPSKEEFRPQPYEQVARCLRNQGINDYSTVLLEKLRIHRKTTFDSNFDFKRTGLWIGLWIFDFFFGYAIKWTPVIITFCLLVVIGTYATDIFNNGYIRWFPFGGNYGTRILSNVTVQPILIKDTETVSTVAISDEAKNKISELIANESAILTPDGSFIKEIRCGDEIEPSLYALDTFVPLLDLRQESKCTITSLDNGWNTLWRILKGLYAILGWIVTSILILTVSGVVKRLVER